MKGETGREERTEGEREGERMDGERERADMPCRLMAVLKL